MTEYTVIVGRAWANEEGSGIHYSSDGVRFSKRKAAIKHGFKQVGCDDFNIGVWIGDELVALDWMYRRGDTDPEVLARVVDSTLA